MKQVGGVFEAPELGDMFSNPPHQFWADVDAGGVGEVVDEERQVCGAGHGAVVFHDGVVSHAVEERGHGADGIDACPCGALGLACRLRGRRGSDVHDVPHAAAVLLRGDRSDAPVLGLAEVDALSSSARNPKAVNAGPHVGLVDGAVRILVQVPVCVHGRNDRGVYSFKIWHGRLHMFD